MSKSRSASHAGSWYSDRGSELNQQLSSWLSKPDPVMYPARAIIAPHAGYYYCGACGAYAYKQVDPKKVKRVFILGPSHHVRLPSCALSSADKYQTPLYDLTIDKQIYADLYATNEFQTMSMGTDEDEHSIEMHLPYIAKVMESRQGQFTIVPILVGSLSNDKEKMYGQLLSRYLADPDNLFVVSSDFCHWGSRFSYNYYDKSDGEIYKSIEKLDRKVWAVQDKSVKRVGMDLIESMDPVGFSEYLRQYKNTICGRHPIGVLLNAIAALRVLNGHKFDMKFLKYAQSSQCKSRSDSSVSYASAALTIQ